MIPVLLWIPTVACLVLGTVFLLTADVRTPWKVGVAGAFLIAVLIPYLVPDAGGRIAGLLIQVGLAIVLVLWIKLPPR